MFGLKKRDRDVIENLLESLSIPMFYRFSKLNKFVTNKAFDSFFGANKKRVLEQLDMLYGNKENFEVEVENELGKKISAIVYISAISSKEDDKLGLVVDITEQKRAKDAISLLKERYELATQGSNEGLWDWDIDNDELYTSVKFKDILEDNAIKLTNSLKSWVDIIYHEDRKHFISELEAHINGAKPNFKVEYRIVEKDSVRWFLARAKVVNTSNKKRVVGFLSDISDIKKAQLALKDSQEQFELFMKNLPAGVFIFDMNENIIFSNRYINEFLGEKTLVSKELKALFDTKILESLRYSKDKVLSQGIETTQILLKDKFDNQKYFQVNIFLLHRDNQNLVGTILTDISAQKLTEQKLDKLAHYDLLTNLPNRALFYESLKNSLAKAQRKEKKVALMFLDLDNFKTINDTLGHDYGDMLLKEVSKKLKSILRTEDIVSRLGGDEFTVILDGIDDSNVFPSVVAQKIIDELTKPIKLKDEMGYIGSSIGIAIYPDDAKDQETLIKFADMAMYQAKENGKNTFRYFTSRMNDDAREKMELTNDLRNAVMNDQLKLYYQPIVDVKRNKLALFEALVRWEHPRYGLITPDNFISLAEEGGFMVKVGRWILNEACSQIKKMEEKGYDVKIAVNVSSKQLTQNHLEQTTKNIVQKHQIRPEHLELEVTEGFLMENIEKVEKTLSNLREFGVGVTIDDFGTGYSSLSRLKSLPISKLKIDKSFITDVVEKEEDKKIILVIIALAKGLGLEIVAEGVETKEQLDFLRKNDVSMIQGYYFSKPISSNKIDKFLEDVVK